MHDDFASSAVEAPGSDELLRLLFDSARDYAIFSTDRAGLVTSWNGGAERLLGWSTAEILGHSADVIFPLEERDAGAAEQERAQALAKGRAEDERWQVRKDGTAFFASGLMMPLDRGRGFVKILRDRTEKHLAGQRLRESEERFRLLATNIPQLVFRSLGDGTRTWPSPQWIAFTGLDTEASLGFGWLDAVHPDDLEITKEGWKAAQASGEYLVEHRVRRASDGEYRWHQTRARPIGGAGGMTNDWVGTMTDVHELRGMQERQQVMMAELQHRTRNLLAVVESIAVRTLRTNKSVEDFGREFVSRLRALSRVQVLINGVDYKTVDLRTLLHAELQAYENEHLEPEKLHVDGPLVSLPARAAQTLALALHELATNAAKYGALVQPAGRLRITWRAERRGEGRWIVLDWKESGVTLPSPAGERRFGYGTELIERALPYQLNAETAFAFEADGVRCTIGVETEDA